MLNNQRIRTAIKVVQINLFPVLHIFQILNHRSLRVPLQLHLNPLNAELNPICNLLVLLGAHLIIHISGIRVKSNFTQFQTVWIVTISPTPSTLHKQVCFLRCFVDRPKKLASGWLFPLFLHDFFLIMTFEIVLFIKQIFLWQVWSTNSPVLSAYSDFLLLSSLKHSAFITKFTFLQVVLRCLVTPLIQNTKYYWLAACYFFYISWNILLLSYYEANVQQVRMFCLRR
jgi:hypothetical protein